MSLWSYDLTIEDGKYSVTAHVVRCGNDICLCIGGGVQPHIGAAALGIARPSLKKPDAVSSSSSVICVTGHKEDDFAKMASGRLAAKFGCVVNVCVGVHIDGGEPEEIARLSNNMNRLLDLVENRLSYG
ncbi:MAG TPA: hypothetical protein GXZ52_07725 [Clostridiales bacterium]|jgi:hypothetical protein|nr:hypothetical protein [Clostridiales bacterium]